MDDLPDWFYANPREKYGDYRMRQEVRRDTDENFEQWNKEQTKLDTAKVVGVFVLIGVVIFGVLGLMFGIGSTDGGHIAVIRNGGPLDDREVREVLPPGQGLTAIGFFSQQHDYPATQRFYTISTDPKVADSGAADNENAPSADGVNLGIDATVYFDLNQDTQTISTFDDKYGTRTFPDRDGKQNYPWEDEAGWSSFLNSVMRPVISNAFRQQIGNFRCAELVSSCALIQNNSAQINTSAVAEFGAKNGANLNAIQEALNKSLQADLDSALGGNFLGGIRVNISKLTLPENVQTAVNQAQGAFAAVSEAQAKVQQAQAEADANRKRQEGYNACPVCGRIDTMKAIPPNVQTYAPGSEFAVTGR